jgi:hypothetical protein
MALSRGHKSKTGIEIAVGKVFFLYNEPEADPDGAGTKFAASAAKLNNENLSSTTTLGYEGASMHHRIFVYDRNSGGELHIWGSLVDHEDHFVKVYTMDDANDDEVVVTGSGMQLPFRFIAIENVSGGTIKVDVESWGSHIR